MNNDIEQASTLQDDVDYRTLNELGILKNITKGLRKIHTTFRRFSLFDLGTEQLISRVNMFFQHYHVLTNLSRKLNASLGYLQLQIGTPHNPFTMDYSKWGYLAPLSWVKMLWKSLHHFKIICATATISQVQNKKLKFKIICSILKFYFNIHEI
jgi:hypothetical protein